MQRVQTVLLVAAGLMLGAQAVSAQDNTPRVDARQKVQKERIKQGVKSGELTRQETRKAVREQKAVDKMEKKAKSDGTVTPRERAKLNKAQNKASRDIHRMKTNERERKK